MKEGEETLLPPVKFSVFARARYVPLSKEVSALAIAETSFLFAMSQNVVDDRLCGESSPLSYEQCAVACPGNCLLSDWSTWSHCSQTCSTGRATGYRTRFRQILATQTNPGNCRAGLRHVRGVRANRAADFSGPPFWTLKIPYELTFILPLIVLLTKELKMLQPDAFCEHTCSKMRLRPGLRPDPAGAGAYSASRLPSWF